jgi:hypothetical protein
MKKTWLTLAIITVITPMAASAQDAVGGVHPGREELGALRSH